MKMLEEEELGIELERRKGNKRKKERRQELISPRLSTSTSIHFVPSSIHSNVKDRESYNGERFFVTEWKCTWKL